MKFFSKIPLALASLAATIPVVRSSKSSGLRGEVRTATRSHGSRSCTQDKKVWLHTFCINGNHDDGYNGEHRLYLGDGYLSSEKKDYEEGKCHNNLYENQDTVIKAWDDLVVGTLEHDTDAGEVDELYDATLETDDWYDQTCATYEVVVSMKFANGNNVEACYVAKEGEHPNLDIPECDHGFYERSQQDAFVFYLEIEPTSVSTLPEHRVGCSKEKWVWMYGFCIEGDHDTGDNGEHKLYLNNYNFLTSDHVEYREDQCHYDLKDNEPMIVERGSLSVGTKEDDIYYDHTLYSDANDNEWYDDTCEIYYLAVSINYKNSDTYACYYIYDGGYHPNIPGIERCPHDYNDERDSFTFHLEIKPARVDYPPGWTDSDGDDCGDYEANSSWCANHGDSWKHNGYTANQACAVCGGGRAQGPP